MSLGTTCEDIDQCPDEGKIKDIFEHYIVNL